MIQNINKRERILKAAASVFARKGFYNSRVAEIAKEANVADGTIYLYFKNKDEILTSLFEEEMTKIIKNLRDELSPIEDTESKIRKFIEKHLSLIEENRELAEVIQIELRQSHKFMKEYKGTKFRDYLNIISSIIIEGQKKGEIREDIIPGSTRPLWRGFWVSIPRRTNWPTRCIASVSRNWSGCKRQGGICIG